VIVVWVDAPVATIKLAPPGLGLATILKSPLEFPLTPVVLNQNLEVVVTFDGANHQNSIKELLDTKKKSKFSFVMVDGKTVVVVYIHGINDPSIGLEANGPLHTVGT
jgi:hypothetical protein